MCINGSPSFGWRSGHAGTWFLNGCLSPNTQPEEKSKRDFHSLANLSGPTPPSTPVGPCIQSLYLCAPLWMNWPHWLLADTEEGRLLKSWADICHWGLKDPACSCWIFQCKRHEFGTIFSTGADGCVVTLHSYSFRQKLTGKQYL